MRDKEFPQKKVLSLVLCVAVMLSVMVMGAGAAFSDQDKIENTEAVDACSALNIIGGYEDGSYHPERNIKRSEITKMICVALNGGKEPNLATPGTPTFSDVRGTTAAWAEKYIESCVSQGIVSGVGGGRFSPAGNVTASQLAKMLLVCLGYDADIEEFTGNAWDTNVNVVATQKGIYEGLSGLDVSAALTRDNAAQMVWNALQATEVTYKYTLVSENGQLVSKVELVDKTGEKGNKITLLEDKYSGAGIYEGILTGAGELGTAGKDKIGMLVVDKLNGATVDGTLKNQVWTYSDDVTNLYMQYVKVLVNNKGDAYGVFPVAKENTVVTDIFANVKQDGDKIKIGGTSYNYDVNKTSGEESGMVYGVKNSSGGTLYINEIAAEVRSGDQITFISNDGDNKFDLAIVNPMTSFGKVTYVDSEKVNVTGVPGAFEEDDIIPDGLVKGDYVAVYKDSFTGNDKLVKAEKVTGKVDATKGSGSTITDVEIDGNWYTLGNKNANEPFQNAVVAKGDSVNGTGDTLTLYVINGVAYQVTKEAGGSTDTAFVIRKTDSIDADGNVQMRVLFADGSEKTIAAKDTTALDSIKNGDLVTYDMEGSAYELTKVDASNKAGGDDVKVSTSTAKFDKETKKVVIDNNSYRVSSDAVVYIQYKETGSNDVKYRTMTGAELNNLGGTFTANADGGIAVIDDGLASVVVLKSSSNYLPGANADKMYGYVTDAGTTREDSNGKYREFTVWTSSNEEQVVKMKATGTSIEKGDLISFDMTSDNFIEGVLSTSDGTNELTVATGAIDQFGKDYMVLFNGKDLTFDDDVKYIYVNGEEGVAGDGLEQAYETANGAYYNNVKYVVDNTTNEVVMVALNTAAEGWNKSTTKPTADAVANKPTGMDVTVNGDTTQIVVSSDEAVEAGVPEEMKKDIFNGTLQEASYTVITLKGFVPQDGTYSIEQENKALGMAYSDYSSSNKKTSNYVNGEGGGEKNGDLSILLAAGKNVKLTIKDSEGKVVKTCTIDTTGLKVESVEN